MKINVVSAKVEDFNEVNVIVKEGQDQHAEALPNIFKKVEQVMPESYFQQLLAESNCDILIAKENQTVIGFVVVEIKKSPAFESMVERKYAYINDFGVKSNYKRGGVGTTLFNACVEWSKEKGAQSLELNVWEFNEQAISFYERFGMKTMSRKMTLNL
ncbi:GNAT family N-acetyltransferase [Ureibacillus sp. Re31]|uniref:GNAT family N-acetyltransferase n=1 Tax=Ureibacillus galli TaxID=2762222 RepID=A0ABR8XA78_9BACL|nr:GNAT family N-acetyltransferase [Ureibacillus galli]MBD8026215.1 GNAT family N-acetyltransferase [Ureibacillus galli]